MEISDIVGVLFVCFSLLFLLIITFIMQSSVASTHILNTVFSIFLNIYVGLLIFLGVGVIIWLFFWLAWSTTTPAWQKKEQKTKRHHD